jgi:tight adherence protein C
LSAIALLAGLATLFVCAALGEILVGAGRGARDRLARLGPSTVLPAPARLAGRALGAALGAIAAWLTVPVAPGRLGLLLAAALPVAGYLLPDALRERERRRQQRQLVAALPDAADLLAVASAAGRSPAAGFAEVARTGSGPLAAELRVLLAEVECGRPLGAALGALRERSSSGEVAALCAAIERSHRLGSPLAAQLRRQATSLRRDQRRVVEERAARAAPKIQLVVALVLVPSVLLMIAAGLIANADLLLAGF